MGPSSIPAASFGLQVIQDGGLTGGAYHPVLVGVTVAISALAIYTALHLIANVRSARGTGRHAWLAGGSIVVGVGLWGAHFVGSLSLRLPGLSVAYDVPHLALSAAAAVLAGALVVWPGTRDRLRGWRLLGAGGGLAGALAAMHYLGAASVRAPAVARWNPSWVAASLAAAAVTGLAGLWIIHRLGSARGPGATWRRLGGGLLLGLALAAVHYLGMAGFSLEPTGGELATRGLDLLASGGLAAAVASSSFLLLGLALAGSLVDAALRRRARAAEENARLYEDAERARSEYEARTRELEHTTATLQALIHSAPLAIIETDRDDIVRTWNPAAERLFGWSAQEVVGRPLPLVPEQRRKEHERLRQSVLAGESVSGVETERCTRDGEHRQVSISLAPVDGEAETRRGTIALISDIGDRKRSEEERTRLLERERRARVDAERSTGKREALAELGQRALAGADAEVLMDTAVRMVAERLEADVAEILQWLPDDPEGDCLLLRGGIGLDRELVGTARFTVDKDSQAGYTLLSRGPVLVRDIHQEARFGPSDLTRTLGAVSALTVLIEGRSGPWGVFGVHGAQPRSFSEDDVAFVQAVANVLAQAVDRGRVEEERRELLARARDARDEAQRRAREEEALRQATEAITASFTIDEVIHQIAEGALLATDADGAFVERIEAELELVRVVAVAGDMVPEVGMTTGYKWSVAERVIKAQEPLMVQVPDGTRGQVFEDLVAACGACSVLAVPLVSGGESIGALLLVRTADRATFEDRDRDRARTFAELAALAFRKAQVLHESERRRGELERVTESRARLVRGFSHDLKNPLGAADGYLELLEDGIVEPASPKGRETISRVRRALAAGLGLIDDLVALAQAESGRIELQTTALDVRVVVREMVEENRARAESKGLAIRAVLPDQVPLLRSDPARVRQILGNLISNAIKYTDTGGVEVRVHDPEHKGDGGAPRWILVSVRDSGPGIPPEEQHQLFREFSRLTREGKDGVGLGLAISQKVSEALGGSIEVESETGQGSTFTLRLPLVAPSVGREAPSGRTALLTPGRAGSRGGRVSTS